MLAPALLEKKLKRDLAALQKANKACFNCSSLANYAIFPPAVTVCASCASLHRHLGHQAKGFGTSTFTREDVAKLQAYGNEISTGIWLAKLPAAVFKPTSGDANACQRWVQRVFRDSEFYDASAADAAARTADARSGRTVARVEVDTVGPPRLARPPPPAGSMAVQRSSSAASSGALRTQGSSSVVDTPHAPCVQVPPSPSACATVAADRKSAASDAAPTLKKEAPKTKSKSKQVAAKDSSAPDNQLNDAASTASPCDPSTATARPDTGTDAAPKKPKSTKKPKATKNTVRGESQEHEETGEVPKSEVPASGQQSTQGACPSTEPPIDATEAGQPDKGGAVAQPDAGSNLEAPVSAEPKTAVPDLLGGLLPPPQETFDPFSRSVAKASTGENLAAHRQDTMDPFAPKPEPAPPQKVAAGGAPTPREAYGAVNALQPFNPFEAGPNPSDAIPALTPQAAPAGPYGPPPIAPQGLPPLNPPQSFWAHQMSGPASIHMPAYNHAPQSGRAPAGDPLFAQAHEPDQGVAGGMFAAGSISGSAPTQHLPVTAQVHGSARSISSNASPQASAQQPLSNGEVPQGAHLVRAGALGGRTAAAGEESAPRASPPQEIQQLHGTDAVPGAPPADAGRAAVAQQEVPAQAEAQVGVGSGVAAAQPVAQGGTTGSSADQQREPLRADLFASPQVAALVTGQHQGMQHGSFGMYPTGQAFQVPHPGMNSHAFAASNTGFQPLGAYSCAVPHMQQGGAAAHMQQPAWGPQQHYGAAPSGYPPPRMMPGHHYFPGALGQPYVHMWPQGPQPGVTVQQGMPGAAVGMNGASLGGPAQVQQLPGTMNAAGPSPMIPTSAPPIGGNPFSVVPAAQPVQEATGQAKLSNAFTGLDI